MNKFKKNWLHRLGHGLLSALLVILSFQAGGEDIEIFTADDGNLVSKPNVLIVLDNSANWSRQSQQWPGGLTQGQSEVRAIKRVVESLDDGSLNIGVMLYSTSGNSNTNEGGYLRHHIRPLNATTKGTLGGHLDTIFDNINAPIEKRNSGNGFGTLMWDVYNYLGGFGQSQSGAGTPSSRADSAAYSTQYSTFRSPLTAVDFCRRTIIIFIGNNVQSGPSADAQGAITALEAAGGDTSQLPFAEFQVQENAVELDRGYSTSCYDSAAACTAAENNAACTEQGFDSCYCEATDAVACLQTHYNVAGVKTTVVEGTESAPQTTASRVSTGEASLTCINPNQVPTYSCPAASASSEPDTPNPGQTTITRTSWSNCAYIQTGTTGCNGNKASFEPQGFRTTTTQINEVTTVTESLPGETQACALTADSCDFSSFERCTGGGMDPFDACYCTSAGSTTGCPSTGSSKFQVVGETVVSEATPTGTFAAPSGGTWIADEWAKFLRQTGVPLPGTNGATKSQVSTYTVDVYNAQQNADFSALLFNMARVGGGKYYQATNEDQIVNALTQIFTEIQAVNSAFSSASLPVNSTNRAQSENQVYLGVFKPDRTLDPRWFGNLKRYQLILKNEVVQLGDRLKRVAINDQTGFIADCALSFWTTDSGDYWSDVIVDDPAAVSACPTAVNPNSDLPDGPFVEKGAAAQILRRSNDSIATPDNDGNYAVSRNMKTLSGGSLIDISTSALSAENQAYVQGGDSPNEDQDTSLTETRASIHGDVIHSRPQPVNYGGGNGVVVYYGANDGAFRAISGQTGEEIWSFVAPEHFSRIDRLRNNSPLVELSGGVNGKPYFFDGSTGVFQNFNNTSVRIYPSQRRGGRMVYGFDVTDPTAPAFAWRQGCTGAADGSCTAGFTKMGQSWSRPSPALVKGFHLTDHVVAYGGGYDGCEDENTGTPSCGVADGANPNPKGAGVYVVKGSDGTILKHFDFSTLDASARSVAADLTFTDPSGDGYVDYAYAATAGGAIYRIDFVDGTDNFAPLAPADWKMSKVAATSGGGRKFLFNPAIVSLGRSTYVAIGSGDREHPLSTHYPTTSGIVNRFYVFLDDLTDVDPMTTLDLDDPSVVADYTSDTGCDSARRLLVGGAKQGWFIDLTAQGSGEQVVTTPVIAAGQVIFSTNRPTPAAANECTTSLGEARGYILDLLTGSGAVGVDGTCGGDRSSVFTGGGLPPSPVLTQVPIENEDGDPITKTVIIGAVEKDGSPSSPIGAQQVSPNISSDREPVSWSHEIDSD